LSAQSIVAIDMVLSDRSIKEALAQGRIVIDPLGDGCIQPSSVDLHVDQLFRVFRNHSQRVIDVREAQEDLTELIDVGETDPMILHPGEFYSVRRSNASRCRMTSSRGSRARAHSADLDYLSTRRPASSTRAGTGTSRSNFRMWQICPSPCIRG